MKVSNDTKEITLRRAKQITDNLLAEMVKSDLINENDAEPVCLDGYTRSSWYLYIQEYFEICENSVRNTAMSKQEYYDWLTEEVGLTLVELDLLELKGVIKVPEFAA